MDNTQYIIEMHFYKGLSFGFRYEGDWIGKSLGIELGFIYLSFTLYSKTEKKNYPIKLFRCRL